MSRHLKKAQIPYDRRPLKIFAIDPLIDSKVPKSISIDIANENSTSFRIGPGPRGLRVEVVDYDATYDQFYQPVDLDDEAVLIQGGLDPSETDPRFHQQMTYAIAMRTIENAELALGRTLSMHRHERILRILPHAFLGANAYYSPNLHAVLFGYFQSHADNPGDCVPGQIVYTCLSHDVVTHEMTHAIVHRMRPLFLEPSNVDVLAFHEAFADIIALLQKLTYTELLRSELDRNRANIEKSHILIGIARQVGHAMGLRGNLRSAIAKPEETLSSHLHEPHARGAILVAAVFDAFLNCYYQRISDLLRIASGGTGELPLGALHPDLIRRVANEAAATAECFLQMCLRAVDYLPPIDVTFGDFLRAMITADIDVRHRDDNKQRIAVIESFRRRGIFPEGAYSISEESLVWDRAAANLPKLDIGDLPLWWLTSFGYSYNLLGPRAISVERCLDDFVSPDDGELQSKVFAKLRAFALQNARSLHLDPMSQISVRGFHPMFRIPQKGDVRIEFVVQFVQSDTSKTAQADLGGIPFRGGVTLIVAVDGTIRYVIAKPLGGSRNDRDFAEYRLDRQRQYVEACDLRDPRMAYATDLYAHNRMRMRGNFALLHQGAC